MTVSPFAGKPAEASMLVNVPKLITAYYTEVPDPLMPEQRGADHLRRILEEAQTIVNDALAASVQHSGIPAKANLKEKP